MCTRANDLNQHEPTSACKNNRCTARCAKAREARKIPRAQTRAGQSWTHVALAPWNGTRRTGSATLARRFRCTADELLVIGPKPMNVGDSFALRGCDLPWEKKPLCGTVAASRELPDHKVLTTLRLVQ